MSINPGFPGEKFNEGVYAKAQKVRAMIDFLAHEFELDPRLSSYGLDQ